MTKNTYSEADALKSAADRLLTNRTRVGLPPIVYHYASMDITSKILDSYEMWCTNIAFSNDPTEGRYGQDLIDNVCTRDPDLLFAGARKLVREEIDGYSISFSADGDELTQWRAYCSNGRGVAIGVDTEVLSQRTSVLFARIEYDQAQQERFIKALLDVFRGRFLSARSSPRRQRRLAYPLTLSFIILRAMLKDPSYHSENEYRLLDALPKPTKRSGMKLEHFSRGELSVPYFRVDLRASRAADANQPIRKVTIGPCLDFDSAVNALQNTRAFHERAFPIDPSRVPMRCD
jgi:hypothetical protein